MNDIHPLDSTRKLATDALERAGASMRDLSSTMTDRASSARGYVGEYASAGKMYVSEHPLKSALIARKRARPGEDLLSALIAARDEGGKLSERVVHHPGSCRGGGRCVDWSSPGTRHPPPGRGPARRARNRSGSSP